MNPRRILPPDGPVVSLAHLKEYVRCEGAEDTTLLEGLEAAAVAHLDGWRGTLGRCIKRQAWAVDYAAPGLHRLPFPDVLEVKSSSGTAELSFSPLGAWVRTSEPCTVELICELPADALPAVKMAIKFMVAHWYDNRGITAAGSLSDVPMTAEALLSPIRWRRF